MGDPKTRILTLVAAYALYNVITQTTNPFAYPNRSTRPSSSSDNK